MKRMLRWSVVLVWMLAWVAPQGAQAQGDKIEWLTLEQAAEKMAKNPKKVIVDVYTDWCGWCKKMDRETFGNAEVAKLVNKDFYAVKLHAEKDNNIIYKDKVYKQSQLAAQLLKGQMAYPSFVYLDEKMNPITVVPGYWGPGDYPKLLSYFQGNLYKKQDLQTYLKGMSN